MDDKILRIPLKSIPQYLQLFNGFLGLTSRELDVLAGFIAMKKKLEESEMLFVDPFSREFRKKVAEGLEMSDSQVRGHLKQLVDKKAISMKDGKYKIANMLIPGNEKRIVFYIK